MLSIVLLLAPAAQVTDIPLEVPIDEDEFGNVFASSFTPDGATWLLPHFGSVVSFDVATSTSVASVPQDDLVRIAAVSADGSRAVFERSFGMLTIHDVPSLAQTALIDDLIGTVDEIIMDRSDTRFLAARASGRIDVFDLASGSHLLSFQTPESAFPYRQRGGTIAADDTTYVTNGRRRVRAYDITTGDQTASFSFGISRRSLRFVADPAGVRAYVLLEDRATGANRLDIDVFELPSLNRLASVPTGLVDVDLGSSVQLAVSDAGQTAIIAGEAGLFTIDLTSGGTQTLADEFVLHAALSADGSTAAAWVDSTLTAFDTATATEIGSQPASSERNGGDAIVAHPRLNRFYSVNDTDRVEIAERLPSGAVQFGDVNSGFGAERDGARAPLEFDDGRRVAVVHQGSDEVVLVDIEAQAASASIPVERAPVAIAALSDGRLAVAHGRGASVVLVDPDTLATVDRIDLSGRADQVEPVPGSDSIWVEVSEPGLRELQLVTTSPATIAGTIPFPPPMRGTSAFQQDVKIDPGADLAAAVDAETGLLTVARLSTRSVIGTDTFAAGRDAQAFIDPAGTRVSVVSSRSEVRSWTVQSGSIALDWVFSCTPASPDFESGAAGVLWPDGSRLIVELPDDCPRVVTLDTANGATLGTSTNNAWRQTDPVDGGVERIGSSSDSLRQYRFEDDDLIQANYLVLPSRFYSPRFIRGLATGRTYGLGRRDSDPLGFVATLTVIDVIADRRIVTCDPSTPNVSGASANLDLQGGGLAGGRLVARVDGLPPGLAFGYLLVADALVPPTPVTGSQGQLCLGGQLGRFVDQVQPADAAGEQRFSIDLTALPVSSGTVVVEPGETWAFQSWYRDQDPAGQATSNFSTAVAVEVL